MRTHEEFEALLDAFLDGELSSEDMQAVQEHLKHCPDCQAYVDDALAIRAAFPTVEDTPVPADFTAGVMAAIQAQSAPAKRRKQPWGKILLPIAACFALVLVLKTAIPVPDEEEAAPVAETGMPFSLADSTPAAEAPEARMAAEPAESDQSTPAAASPYFTHITLDASAIGTLLDGWTPIQETEGQLCYELSAQEYQTLLEQLAQLEILPMEEVPADQTAGALALVTVLK